MNLVKSITPLLTIFGLDNGQETAVVTRPALPMWQPAPGDVAGIERVINRVRVDGNVTIYEQEIVYIQNQPTPEPERPYEFETYHGDPVLPPGQIAQIVADWHAGRARWTGGPPDPDQALRNAFAPRRQARVLDGRIVLQE